MAAGRFVFALAAAVVLAAPVMASDRACTRETIGRAPLQSAMSTAMQATLDSIFDRGEAPSVVTKNGVTGEFGPMEVVMVRIKDGKPVLVCVDSKEAATRFLTAPVEKIGTTKTAEEK